MRRAILLILLLLPLGVSTSLGVAWFIGGVQPGWASVREVDLGRSGEWYVRHWKGIGQSIWSGLSLTGFRYEIGDPAAVAAPGSFEQSPRFADDALIEYHAGWPTRSWRVQLRAHPSGYGSYGTHDVIGGGLIGRSRSAPGQYSFARFLPFHPSGPTVMLDVAFWALVWFAIAAFVAATGLFRRRLRLRRNRCTMCGYDLRGHDAARCSECGAARGERGPILGSRLLGALGTVLILLVIAQMTIGAKVAGLSHGPNRLHLAARDGNVRAIERALKNGVPVDVLVEGEHHAAGTTPLIWAIAGDQPEAVELLLDHEADAKVRDENGLPAIVLATETRNEQVFAALLSKGADPNTTGGNGQPVLYRLIGEEGGSACARWLIEAGADVNAHWRSNTPLALAARVNDVEIARLLIVAGAHVNAPVQNLPIIAAVKDGHVEMAQLLIEAGAEVARSELDLLRLAVESGSTDLVTLLLAHGTPRTLAGDSMTPLHLAVAECDTAMVRLLAQSGFDPNERDLHGRTPLEQAIDASMRSDGYGEILEILDAAVRAWYPGDGDDHGG